MFHTRYIWHFILHGRLSIHIWQQQFVDSFFFTVGVSRSKSIIRILVANVFVFLASFAFFVLGEINHSQSIIHIWRQQFAGSFFLTVGVSRSKSIIRILVADVFVFLASFAFFVLGEMPLRNRMGAWGAPVPFAKGSIPPPVLSMTYVNSGPSPQPEITFFVTANNKG